VKLPDLFITKFPEKLHKTEFPEISVLLHSTFGVKYTYLIISALFPRLALINSVFSCYNIILQTSSVDVVLIPHRECLTTVYSESETM